MVTVTEVKACKNCHYVGFPRMPGSTWIEIVLWCCYLIPGLIYSIWRRDKTRGNICPQCSAPFMLSLTTPAGRAIADQQTEEAPEVFIARHLAATKKKSGTANGAVWFILICVLITMFFRWSVTGHP